MPVDILYIVLSIAVAILTGFAAYVLYYHAQTTKEAKKALMKINRDLDRVDDAIENATAAANSVSRLVKNVTDALDKPMNGVVEGLRLAQTVIERFQQRTGSCRCEDENEPKDREEE